MPWTADDANDHVDGLTARQRTVWARVANKALAACRVGGGSQAQCEARALREAATIAKRSPGKALKLADDGALEILAIPFGGPLAGKDADGEYFTERTDLCLDWFPTHRPLLYHHGLDDAIAVTPIGKVDASTLTQDEAGWWVKGQLDKSSRYWKHISQLLAADEEALFASSGSLPHLFRRSKDGEILRWPWVELSLTPTPSNLFATVTPAAAKAHYTAAGLTPPPTIDTDDTRSYADLLDRLTDDVGDFAELTQRLTLGRTKVGRPQLSDKRRERLSALRKRLRELDSDLHDLLSETEPKPAEPDAASTKASGDALRLRIDFERSIARQFGVAV